ncbi:hypothetical protein MRX96_050855 [Rhipicephalus microplus]
MVSPRLFMLTYWRLQDVFQPIYRSIAFNEFCGTAMLYTRTTAATYGKYPSVATYQNSLRDIKVQRQILHRGNDIAVYFALGEVVEVHGVFGVCLN